MQGFGESIHEKHEPSMSFELIFKDEFGLVDKNNSEGWRLVFQSTNPYIPSTQKLTSNVLDDQPKPANPKSWTMVSIKRPKPTYWVFGFKFMVNQLKPAHHVLEVMVLVDQLKPTYQDCALV